MTEAFQTGQMFGQILFYAVVILAAAILLVLVFHFIKIIQLSGIKSELRRINQNLDEIIDSGYSENNDLHFDIDNSLPNSENMNK